MSELDDIKARASQRRAVHHFERGHLPLREACHAAEADLDRAITLLEEAQRACHVYQFDNGRSVCVKCGEEQRSVIDF